MRAILFFALIISLFGCKKAEPQKTILKSNSDTLNNISAKDSILLNSNCIQKDTLTPFGTQINYIYQSGKFMISCSNSNFERISDSSYSCEYDISSGLWDFVPKLEAETQNVLIFKNILFTSSGGNPHPLEFSATIFPKNNKDPILEREFLIMTMGNYLIYGDSDESIIHIENVETKKIQNIKLTPAPYLSRSPTLSISETVIKDNKLYIEYEALNEKTDDLITIKRSFKIEI